MRFEFATATRIVFGPGARGELGPIARAFGGRALIVTGRHPERSDWSRALLEKEGVRSSFLAVAGEPSVQEVERGVALIQSERIEFVIGIGGGSAIDGAKAMAGLAPNDGSIWDYLEVIGRGKPLLRAALPFIAIPTTAGAGAEVTRNAVLTSVEHRVKASLRSSFLLPRVAIVDPELTSGLPRAITASTGLDALTQLIEPFVSCRSNPLTDACCREGMARIARSLRRACGSPGDAAAREDMSLASLLGGLALANAGLGAVHGFAAPLGGMFPAPHGAVCAALLPHVMQANLTALRDRQPENAGLGRYQEVACILTGRAAATAEDGVQWIRELCRDLEIPRLQVWGVQENDWDSIVEKAALASSMKANPIALNRDELRAILASA